MKSVMDNKLTKKQKNEILKTVGFGLAQYSEEVVEEFRKEYPGSSILDVEEWVDASIVKVAQGWFSR